MTSFSFATASAAVVVAIATVGIAPATASTLSFDYDGTIDISAELSFFANQLLGENASTVEQALNFSDSFAGTFDVSDDPNQYLDGDINIEYDFFSDLTGFDWSDLGITGIEDMLDLNFSGTGSLWSETANASTDFDFAYDSAIESIVITGYDTDIVEYCSTGYCTTEASGEFDLFTTIFESETALVNGDVNLVLSTEPESMSETEPTSIPEPTPWLGLVGIGAWMLKKKTAPQHCA
ncbi:hypothetical protein [Phormidium sp. CCY1219]|uniref:hypothetical protein n=1 Tax=Phormidium sp. CCY1219 TaxID=2886104 RepID=UPI002D1F4476|nr:hypothetical protein [Phormidium sp. CCY1219]MEB3829460.1 hypothetical protein [Phormidium sp. CCY1219]